MTHSENKFWEDYNKVVRDIERGEEFSPLCS